jgi:hypothetical protein
MSRARLTSVALIAGAALAAAGVAAAGHRGTQSTQAAAATFTASSVSRMSAKTCTASDGSYRETTATYEGTASSSDARLNGALTIRAHSVVDTTTGLGWVDGSFRIRGSSGGAQGSLHAAIAGGQAAGGVDGQASGRQGKLVASAAAAFSPDGGFTSGSLGTGSAPGIGVVFHRGACTRAKAVHSVYVSRLRFGGGKVQPGSRKATGSGSFTLDVTRDASGAITDARAVFYVNYRFGAPVTITQLALHQGVKGSDGAVVLDAGSGSIADSDGAGNLTKVVTGVSGAFAQTLLSNPRGYYVELATSSGPSLRAQLGGFGRR